MDNNNNCYTKTKSTFRLFKQFFIIITKSYSQNISYVLIKLCDEYLPDFLATTGSAGCPESALVCDSAGAPGSAAGRGPAGVSGSEVGPGSGGVEGLGSRETSFLRTDCLLEAGNEVEKEEWILSSTYRINYSNFSI